MGLLSTSSPGEAAPHQHSSPAEWQRERLTEAGSVAITPGRGCGQLQWGGISKTSPARVTGKSPEAQWDGQGEETSRTRTSVWRRGRKPRVKGSCFLLVL